MQEKRKAKRAPFNSKITIESLYSSGDREGIKLNENITITNISKTGIGFVCAAVLPTNNYFNCRIEINEDEVIYCVLKIVRCMPLDEGYQIGAEYIGMADIIGEHIDEFVEQKGQ